MRLAVQGKAAQLPAELAARAEDPWRGFASLAEDTRALFAGDRGYADVYRSSITLASDKTTHVPLG